MSDAKTFVPMSVAEFAAKWGAPADLETSRDFDEFMAYFKRNPERAGDEMRVGMTLVHAGRN